MPWFFIAAAFAIVSGGVAYVSASKAAKQAKKLQKDLAGVLVNKNSNNEPIPVVYGTRRIGITRVFVSTQDASNGDPNEYLYICGVLCEGEVESISEVLIDGLPTNDARFNYSNSISINYHYGTDSQTVDTLLQEADTNWGANHRLRGVAYLGIRLKYNADAFSGIPEITALVEGKKVYDPRTTLTGFSSNPALCIRDYLTNSRYGKGLDSSAIDDTAFGDAADDCETTVTYYTSGTTGPLFECNAVLDTSQSLFNNLQEMLIGCRAFLPYKQGVYSLLIDKSSASVLTLTTDEIIGGIEIKGESKKDKANRYVVTFVNEDARWQEDSAIWPDAGSSEETTYLAEDGGTLLQQEITLPTITNYYMARELARILVIRSRNALRASFKCTSEALQLTPGDVVSVTHGTPGWTAKPFQVEEIGLSEDGTCQLQVIEYDSTAYTFDTGAQQQTYPDTNLPNPYSVEAPTSLTITETAVFGPDGTVQPIITASWTAPDDGFLYEYEVQWKKNADGTYQSRSATQPSYQGLGSEAGVLYDVRVRAINALGVHSDWDSATYTPGGTYSIINSEGINAPTNARLWITLDKTQPKALARIEVTVDLSTGVVPDFLVVAYSYADAPNQLAILTDNGTDKLYLDPSNADSGIAGEFELTAATGSTTSVVNYTDPSGAIDIDLSGNWWMRVDNGVSQTRFHKVHRVTSSALYLPPGETLSLTPSNGDTIDIIELDWNDARPSEFKLFYINGEIIVHDGIDYDTGSSQYYLDAVTRGAEGTTQASQTGQVGHYFPALGPGSHILDLSLAQFTKVGSTYTFSGTIDIDVPSVHGWSTGSCFFVKLTTNNEALKYVRSNISTIEYVGPV